MIENLELIIYKDIQNPTIELLSFQNIDVDNKKLIFKLKDDININSFSINLTIDGDLISNSLMNMTGDIYSFDISSISDGTVSHSFTLSLNLFSNSFQNCFDVIFPCL